MTPDYLEFFLFFFLSLIAHMFESDSVLEVHKHHFREKWVSPHRCLFSQKIILSPTPYTLILYLPAPPPPRAPQHTWAEMRA